MKSSKEKLEKAFQNKIDKSFYVFSRGDNYLAQDRYGNIVYVKGREKAEQALQEIKELAGFRLIPLIPLKAPRKKRQS